MERFTRRDLIFLAVCGVVAVISLVVVGRYFGAAFPEASIDFRYDREGSRPIAESLLRAQGLDVRGMKHTAVFDADDEARIFLERSIGLEKASAAMRSDVRVWYWHHRWFKPLQEEEFRVDIAPTGELVSFTRTIPEATKLPPTDEAAARNIAEGFLARNRIALADLELVSQSERALPNRVQRILTWDSKSVHPAGATLRHTVTVDGNAVSSYGQGLKIPEEWLRSYRELRSKNLAAGNVDTIFLAITMVAAIVVFVVRLRRGDLRLRFLLAIGLVALVLVIGETVNSYSEILASYDTTTSFPAFIGQIVVLRGAGAIGTAILLIVICGAGEVLYRERLPQHLAIPNVWTPRALASKRVFLSMILGYTLVAFFIAYQTAFYLISARFGAWSPADVPYDNILNTAIPWVAVLFAGFFPAFSEEFLSRAFSIPFFQRFVRSRFAAIVLAGFIWGFGHSTYPNQPFYIRGLEVGLAGVVIGYLMDRYGLLSLLIWHYTVDAVYTSLLLFRSGNTYYVTSAAIASAVFAVPLIASVVLFIRNRGFVPDDDLTNATLPVAPPEPRVEVTQEIALPPAQRAPRWKWILCIVAVIVATVLVVMPRKTPQDVVDYRITKDAAKEIAARHIQTRRQELPQMVAAVPVPGFRYWDEGSSREEGGAPGGFDDVAATYLLRNGVTESTLTDVMRSQIHAATWTVRFFTPTVKTEYFVEIDPRTSRVVGYHKYAEETAAGPRLEREDARVVAQSAFATYGVNLGDFDVREALAFQQPNRRDWLFHFDAKKPIAAQAFHRISVRVMGSEVTQFASTIKIPDEVYRAAQQSNIFDVTLIVLRLAGMVLGLALIVAGLIMATRHGVPWRRALRFTLLLAIIPLMSALSQYESTVYSYNTSVAWDTFTVNLVTNLVRTAGLQTLLLFICVAALLTIHPYVTWLWSREGRARLGRDAAIAAVTTIALIAAARELMDLVRSLFRSAVVFQGIHITDSIALPLPALFDLADALFETILFGGAIALYFLAIRSWPRQSIAVVATVLIIFFVSLDTSVDARALPLSVLSAALTAIAAWLLARYVLNGNPAAWPLTVFVAAVLQSGVMLALNARADLRIHATILIAAAAAAIVWSAAARSSSKEAVESPAMLEG